MKKELVLNQPGVMELGKEELKEIDGGWIQSIILIFSQDIDALIDAFNEGRALYRDSH